MRDIIENALARLKRPDSDRSHQRKRNHDANYHLATKPEILPTHFYHPLSFFSVFSYMLIFQRLK
jgi:hypothetical protein